MGRKGKFKPGDRPASPKRLREQLRKADAKVARARDKRDRAQARVEALGIIADEIRATLTEVQKAAAAETATGAQEAAHPDPSRKASVKPAAKTAARQAAKGPGTPAANGPAKPAAASGARGRRARASPGRAATPRPVRKPAPPPASGAQ
ncbi:hypothetical protein BH23CHL8_BH23CHL8_22940 [soil metagenome]